MTPREFLTTEDATDFGDVAFTTEQWEAVYGWMNDFIQHQGQNLPLYSVSYCAEQTRNLLCNKFAELSKKHMGKKINEVPELSKLLDAINEVAEHCS